MRHQNNSYNIYHPSFFKGTKPSQEFSPLHIMYLLNMKGGPIPWPGSVATSPAVPGRRIGRMNGLDLAFSDHFAKKPSNFIEINPRSNFLRNFCEKTLNLSQNQPAVQQSGLRKICKENLKFLSNQPAILSSLKIFFTKTLRF